MTQQIPIQSLANQGFTVTLDNNVWEITIKATNGVMSMSLKLNGVAVVDNMRAVAGMRIIPSKYEEAGNFVFYTQNFELPDYKLFNTSQCLVYYSAAELALLRGPTTPRMNADYFNGIAPLPLRFRPQGYV